MLSELKELEAKFSKQIGEVTDISELMNLRSQLLGKKSLLWQVLNELKRLPVDQRKEVGGYANRLQQRMKADLAAKELALIKSQSFQPVDITTPSAITKLGHLHPSTLVMRQLYQIFSELGFAIVDGPEIETDWYCFEALNMPPEHPARDMQDTFYIKSSPIGHLLPRTHTSSMQMRYMENHEPPFKIVVPGRVFRNENEDATHAWIFHQLEGLVVGEGVSVSDLKGTLLHFAKRLLGADSNIRLRPSFFPYTEPSMELDVWYKDSWLELGGAGMVHPDVLSRGGIDPERFSGFAFGFGPDRIAVVQYGINDLRQFWRPNLRFLEQF